MWTRREFEQDKQRYETAIAALREAGYIDDHPLIRNHRRRLDAIERVLTGNLSGLIEEDPDDPATA
jgi:hypothetical protein